MKASLKIGLAVIGSLGAVSVPAVSTEMYKKAHETVHTAEQRSHEQIHAVQADRMKAMHDDIHLLVYDRFGYTHEGRDYKHEEMFRNDYKGEPDGGIER